jgi:signal transduction histidine kinase
MPAQTTLLIIIETLLLLVLLVILIYKSVKLSHLINEMVLLRKYGEKQSEVQRERDDFLAMLVHELRSPLSVMKGASDLMLKDAHNLSKEQIETLLNQIRNSSTGMLNIVNDLLDVSKLESGKFEIEKVQGNLNQILREESSYYESVANAKQISIVCELDEGVQDFKFDPDRIRQVMKNLLSNAVKYTPENGIVTVKTFLKDDMVRICICDTGEGITDDMKHKLFHKFVQLNNHNHIKEKGTGLGLVIAKGIVEAHGGSIWVEDNKPKGSKFVFTIPLK